MEYRDRYGEWAVVVGASEGLGAALADELAKRGMDIVLVARRAGPLVETARSLSERRGVRTKAIIHDAADPRIVDVIEAGLEGAALSFLVYNCAAEHKGLFLDVGLEEHLNNIEVNCVAPTRLAHAFGAKMAKRGRGGIVLCSSLAAEQGIWNWTSYGAAKAYLTILGEGLWDELRELGVDVTAFMIGLTYTPNFQRFQKANRSGFANSGVPEGLAAGIPLPQLPEAAAAALFAQIDEECLPRIYASRDDQLRREYLAAQPRKFCIERIGGAMRSRLRPLVKSD